MAGEVQQRRIAPDLVLRRVMSLVDYSSQLRRKGRSVAIGSKSTGEGYARAHEHEFPKLLQLLRASLSC